MIRNANSEKYSSFSDYLNKGTVGKASDDPDELGELVMYINRYKNAFVGYNVLCNFFHINQKKANEKYEVKEPIFLCELLKYVCNHPKTGSFKDTFIYEDNSIFDQLNESLNDDAICRDIDELKTKISFLKKDCEELFYHYKSKYNLDEIKKKLSKDARSVIDAFEKQKNIYEVIRTISKKYDLLSDYMNSIEFIINGCKIIYEDSDSLAILRFLHQYISYSYLIYDSKSLRRELNLKQFMNHEENLIEKHFEDKKLSKRIKSYLKEAYEKKVNKPEAQQYESLRLYFCEQMLNFCTANYLTKKIIETGLHKDMEILKKEILPSIVYIFMMPNLFSRKIYINEIINMYSEGKLYNTNPFHRQSKFDPMGGVDINTGAAPIKEISCIVKQFLLHQSLTYTVIYEACFYGNLKAYFDNDKQKLCAFIE